MIKEYNSISLNEVWELTELPEDKKAIITMWVFRYKKLEDGTLLHKGRLVVLGNKTKPDIDFDSMKTYAPVAKMPSLRVFFSLVVQYNMDMIQLDVVTAFQYALIDKEIYVEIPYFFELCEHDRDLYRRLRRPVLKLKKALYGLPQSPRLWFETINKFLLSLGYVSLDHEPCFYILKDKQGTTINMLLLYVDDMIIAATSTSMLYEI